MFCNYVPMLLVLWHFDGSQGLTMARPGALSAPGKQQVESGLVGLAQASLTVQGLAGRGGLRVMQEGGLTVVLP